jgi:hypothetical protein
MAIDTYLLQESKAAIPLAQNSYDKEDELQEIVAKNAGLLIRPSEIDSYNLYLVKREQSLDASEADTSYSLDHLFIGSDAVPVLVEVKLSTNSKIHREVAAQMLDYASHLKTEPVENIRNNATISNGGTLPSAIADDSFWDDVENNIKADRMKLVFVADSIPGSLRIIMEFMDRTMPSLDIYGVEIKKHSNGSSTILSRNFIQSAVKQEAVAKIARETFQWTQETYDQRVLQIADASSLEIIRKIRSFALECGMEIRYGAGTKQAGLLAYVAEKYLFTIYIYSNPTLKVDISKVNAAEISGNVVSDSDATAYFESMKSFAPNTKITEKYVQVPFTDLKSVEAQNKLFAFFKKVLGKEL